VHREDPGYAVAAVVRLAAIVALALMSSATVASAACVNVGLRFRPDTLIQGIVEAMKEEAASIWRSYGVEIAWVSPANPTGCEMSLGTLDVLVDRSHDASEPSAALLGSTRVPRAIGRVPVHINADVTESVLQEVITARVTRATGHPAIGPQDIGRAP
jgi:hypothetical protein